MNLEQRLRESLVAPDPGAVFTARVMARMTRGRARRGRFIVIGTFVVLAAAAVLTWQLTASRAPAGAIADHEQADPLVTPTADESRVAGASEARTEGSSQSGSMTTQESVLPTANPAALRILLMPPQHNAQDPAAKPAIDAFHSSLLQALRNTPDVMVEIAGAESDKDQPFNRVTVVSPKVTILPSGTPLYHSGDGRTTWQGFVGTYRGPPQWPVEVIAKPAIQTVSDNGMLLEQRIDVHQFINGIGVPNGQSCDFSSTNSTLTPAASSMGPTLCSSVQGLVAWLVVALQPRPVQPILDTAQLVSRLSDVSNEDRPGALRQLLGRASMGRIVLDPAAIKAITAYIASSPMSTQRLSSMYAMRGVRQPGLVVPLLEVLQHDADEKVRLEALSVLLADYGTDSRIRAVLETVARQDASRLVRMAAQQPLSGDAQWQSYVMATLADASLSVVDRLAPAQFAAREAVFPSSVDRIPSYLKSELFVRQLLDVFEELRVAARQPSSISPAFVPSGLAERLAELGTTANAAVFSPGTELPPGLGSGNGAGRIQDGDLQSVLRLLTITNPSAATDLRLRILTEDPLPPTWLIMNSLNELVGKRDDPRIGKVLNDIAAGKSGPELRSALERSMAMRPAPDQ